MNKQIENLIREQNYEKHYAKLNNMSLETKGC